MKKIILLAAVLICSVSANNAFAQLTGTATLNITLSDVLSMTVTQPVALNVNFNTETAYTSGITASAVDHISVVSSKGYTVKAISGVITGPSTLTAASVVINAALGTGNTGNTAGVTFPPNVVLPAVGGAAATVITSTNTSWLGAISTSKFNVDYKIGAGGQYAGKTTGVNAIPVIYTVTQP